MEDFILGVYDFFENNIYLATILLALGVIATILEKSSKIKTPISTLIKKYKERKKLQEARWNSIDKLVATYNNIDSKLQEIERVVGHPSEPYQQVYSEAIASIDKLATKIDKIGSQVFENEQDRLRGELFNCGNRCRRGIPLTLEEYRFISHEYERYSEELHCNGIGTTEFAFITQYFNNQKLN